MRTTLDIDDDVLAAAKELARMQRVSAGQVITRLVREALSGHSGKAGEPGHAPAGVGGFRPFPSRGVMVSNEQVNAIRDQEGV